MEKDSLTLAFSRLHLRMVAMARRFLSDSADVDDALQDAFCRLWSNRSGISPDRDASGLVITTVRNVCIDAVRRKNSCPSTVEITPSLTDDEAAVSADDAEQRQELFNDVTAVIDEILTDRQREILYNRECNGWSMEDLAQHYGLTEANVRMILSRARSAVRNAYRNHNKR